MNGAEMFMGSAPAGALRGRFLRRLAVQDRHLRPGLQLVLAVDHDLLVGLQAGIDQRLAGADLRDVDRPNLDRVVGIETYA